MANGYRSFFIRPIEVTAINRHDESVVPRLDADVRRFVELYQNVFQHHVEPFPATTIKRPLALEDQSGKRYVANDEITNTFISSYEVNPISKTKNLNNSLDLSAEQIDFKSFMSSVVGSPLNRNFDKDGLAGSNRVSFLLGDIGVGKSLLTARTVNAVRESQNWKPSPGRKESRFREAQVIPIYVDVDGLLLKKDGFVADIDEAFWTKVLCALEDQLSRHTEIFLKIAHFFKQPIAPAFRVFRDVSKSLLTIKVGHDGGGDYYKEVRLFIIFDNIDRLHFHYAKYSFIDDYRKKQEDTIKTNIDRLLEVCTLNQNLGNCGICILIVCRKATYQNFTFRSDLLNNRSQNLRDLDTFVVSPAAPITVIQSRFTLLRKLLKPNASDAPGFLKRASESVAKVEDLVVAIFSDRAKDDDALRVIARLGHQGARSLVDFFGQLSPDWHDEEILGRTFGTLAGAHSSHLLRLYMSGVKKRYAQEKGVFPNLFLVDALASHTTEFATAHSSHRHTYWLKYLMMKRIKQRTLEANQQFVTYGALREEFRASAFTGLPIFELALGSLASSTTSGCIEIAEPVTNNVLRISLTSRGRELLKVDPITGVEFCFGFDYLQLVVDDYLLSLPNDWWSEIFVDADLGYTLLPYAVYRSGVKLYIVRKSKAVLVFLLTLRAASKSEIRQFNVTEPDSHLVDSCIPNFDVVLNAYKSHITSILSHLPGGDTLIAEFVSYFNTQSLSSRYDEFFANYELAGRPNTEFG